MNKIRQTIEALIAMEGEVVVAVRTRDIAGELRVDLARAGREWAAFRFSEDMEGFALTPTHIRAEADGGVGELALSKVFAAWYCEPQGRVGIGHVADAPASFHETMRLEALRVMGVAKVEDSAPRPATTLDIGQRAVVAMEVPVDLGRVVRGGLA